MKTRIAEDKTPDVLTAAEPTISFSHLASCFSGQETDDDDHPIPAYGFPAPREEKLYETGVLAREFLKC